MRYHRFIQLKLLRLTEIREQIKIPLYFHFAQQKFIILRLYLNLEENVLAFSRSSHDKSGNVVFFFIREIFLKQAETT